MNRTYQLSDGLLAQLSRLMKVEDMKEKYSEHLPSSRTIRRRLECIGITRPDYARQTFKRLLLERASRENQEDPEGFVNRKISEELTTIDNFIHSKIEEFESRFE